MPVESFQATIFANVSHKGWFGYLDRDDVSQHFITTFGKSRGTRQDLTTLMVGLEYMRITEDTKTTKKKSSGPSFDDDYDRVVSEVYPPTIQYACWPRVTF